MTFIKPVEPNKRKAKVLYLMGATWHNKSMFDLDSQQPSLASILQAKGIESYTFDIFGSGPGPKEGFIGNQHEANIDYAVGLVEQYNIDYIFAYSYGGIIAVDVALRTSIKGIIMLDPFANISIPFGETTDGDKYIVDASVVAQALIDYDTNIDSNIVQSHLASLSADSPLITATYPKIVSRQRFKTFFDKNNFLGVLDKCRVQVILTKDRPVRFEQLGIPDLVIRNNNYSHWIMLEDGRFWLAEQISRFV
jgi:pimeloyl-ACP methyl ester carboxylesterase